MVRRVVFIILLLLSYHHGIPGLIAIVQGVSLPRDKWVAGGMPLPSMMTFEKRKGKMKPVIKKALVDLHGTPYAEFARRRGAWAHEDMYVNVGPIQYGEDVAGSSSITHTLRYEHNGGENKTRARL